MASKGKRRAESSAKRAETRANRRTGKQIAIHQALAEATQIDGGFDEISNPNDDLNREIIANLRADFANERHNERHHAQNWAQAASALAKQKALADPETAAEIDMHELPKGILARESLVQSLIQSGDHAPAGETLNGMDVGVPFTKNDGLSTKRFDGDDGPIFGKSRKTFEEGQAIIRRQIGRAPQF